MQPLLQVDINKVPDNNPVILEPGYGGNKKDGAVGI